MMSMSVIIAKTEAAKKRKVKEAYAVVLDILEYKILGAEILPGNILKLSVDENSADTFVVAVKDIEGGEVLHLETSRIWRSGCTDVLNVEFDRLDDIDNQWNKVIDEIGFRAEML